LRRAVTGTEDIATAGTSMETAV